MLRKFTAGSLLSLLTAVLLLVLGAGIGRSDKLWPTREAQGQVRVPGAPGHFKSGGERSAELLREISVTLKRMDQRLENIEEMLEKSQHGDR